MRSILLLLSQRLLTLAMDAALRRALPAIYKRLDAELPYWINQSVAGKGVEHAIAQAASDALGRSPEPHELNIVRLLYDPVAAAQGAFKAWERKQS